MDRELQLLLLGGLIGFVGAILGGLAEAGFSYLFENLRHRREERRCWHKTALEWANTGRAESLQRVDLRGADLRGVDLAGADLSHANLHKATLSGATLSGANLFKVDLRGACLSGLLVELISGETSGTTREIPGSRVGADLSEANLFMANLSGANLATVNLENAILVATDLTKADLSGANVTDAQLVQAKSLKGAIMPDGTKHD